LYLEAGIDLLMLIGFDPIQATDTDLPQRKQKRRGKV